ncbi:hypothetical protein GWN42_31355 [candidate division KSB1 bacterium]|nr:hypothetical protein [Phycisphaerae bacterium]NIQ92557.1 hypothetical protein [Deltaproteobacteria bacterium]NIV97167.1 hypothetical protein [candidate division KSB1 bacterium]
MNNGIGKITRVSIGQNDARTGPARRLVLQVATSENVQDLEHMQPAGEDSAPATGDEGIIMQVADDFYVVIAFDDGITPEAQEGEKIIYAHTPGSREAFIKLGVDGEISLGNKTVPAPDDYAVLYNELKREFNELKQKFNTFVDTYSNHLHASSPLGPSVPPSSPGMRSTADITTTKSGYIRIGKEV